METKVAQPHFAIARDRVAIWCAYAGMCFIWGTTWLAIKIGLHTVAPLTGVGLRFLIAGMFLYPIAALRGELVSLRNLPWNVVLVIAFVLIGADYTLVYTSETRLDSGLAAVLFATMPFFTFGFSRAMIGERTTPRILTGALTAFAGVALVSLTGAARGSPLFALAPVGAAASAAFGNVYAKRYGRHAPLVTLPPAMVIVGMTVLIAGLLSERSDWAHAFTGSSLLALLYLAIVGSGIAFFSFMWLLQRLSASTVGLCSLVFPVIAIIVGALFGSESTTPRELLGSCLVIAGLWIALT